MSNWIDMQLDVLSPNLAEIIEIEAALQRPCQDLLNWVAERCKAKAPVLAADVRKLVTFKPAKKLGSTDPARNRARRFEIDFKTSCWGTVWSHVYLTSAAHPESVFLLEYWDTSMSYPGKCVIKAARDIRQIHDGNQQAQAYEWVLPNICAPFRSEHETDVPFGLYWDAWLLETEKAFAQLKERYGIPTLGTTCESALLGWEGRFGKAASAADEVWTTLAKEDGELDHSALSVELEVL